MRAPVLNRALVLEERAGLADGMGGYDEVWVPLGTLWAEVSLRSGRAAAGEDVALALTAWRIRVRAAAPGAPSRPRAGQRFREGGRLFAIRAVAEEGPEGRYLVCVVDEEVAA